MKIYNIATIGTSSIAAEFMETVKDIPNIRLHTVYSRDIKKAALTAEKYGAERYTDSLQSICDDNEVDAVYIASPNSFCVMPRKVRIFFILSPTVIISHRLCQ